MPTIEKLATITWHVYVHSYQRSQLGVVRDADGTAVDISATAATLKCLLKEHAGDTDADAIAEVALTGDADGTLIAELAEAEAEKLIPGRTYYGSVAITFAPDHAVTAFRSKTMPAGDVEIQAHDQATRDT